MKLNSQVFSVLDNNTNQTDSPLRPHTNVSFNTHNRSEIDGILRKPVMWV